MKKRTNIDMGLADVFDRITILSLKIANGDECAYKEHTYLCEGIDKLGIRLTGALGAAVIRLAQDNLNIWFLENSIRNDTENKMDNAEIGRRAKLIRDFNKKRIEHKNEINRLTEMGFREFKICHRSQ